MVVCVDNETVVGAVKKGSSAKEDLLVIVGMILDKLFLLRVEARFIWVPSALNCSDFPSRSKVFDIEGVRSLCESEARAVAEKFAEIMHRRGSL